MMLRPHNKIYTLCAAAMMVFGCTSQSGPSSKPQVTEPAKRSDMLKGGDGPVADGGLTIDQKETRKLLPPLAAPAAYFGDLGRNRVVEPLLIDPDVKNSVVLIIVDTLNVRHMSTFGYDRQTTPNLDKLADDGIIFTNYISNSSWTRPSATTILTGLPKRDHKVEVRGPPLVKSIVTLAERFKEAGYKTYGLSGNPLIRDKWGFDQGFDKWHDLQTLDIKAFVPDSRLMRPTIEWVERMGPKPFFLMVFLTAPHQPYRPLDDWRHFLKTVPRGPVTEHPFKEYKKPLPENEQLRILAAYDDEIRYEDHLIARLLEALDKKGRTDDTAIILTADHGEMMGQHNCYLHAYHQYEQTLKVPLIIKSPRLKAKKAFDDRPFTHVDIAPTALDLAGIEVPESLPGKSIVKMLADPSQNRERIIYSQYNAHGVRRQAIRKGRFKLVHHHKVEKRAIQDLESLNPSKDQPHPRNLPSLAWKGERYELYDLVADPEENNNIYEKMKNSEEVAVLTGELSERFLDDEKPNMRIDIPKDMLEALEAAGYITPD